MFHSEPGVTQAARGLKKAEKLFKEQLQWLTATLGRCRKMEPPQLCAGTVPALQPKRWDLISTRLLKL